MLEPDGPGEQPRVAEGRYVDRALRFRNFDAIRIVAAASVIFSHAFLIAEGHELNEPMVRLLGKGNILGVYGVFVFLIISGFLVAQSFLRSASILEYGQSRFLRIFPGLLVCASITTFVVAPWFSGSFSDEYLLYLRDVLLLQDTHWMIPGVRFYGHEGWLGLVLNGS